MIVIIRCKYLYNIFKCIMLIIIVIIIIIIITIILNNKLMAKIRK